jgi:hypothetical protein
MREAKGKWTIIANAMELRSAVDLKVAFTELSNHSS